MTDNTKNRPAWLAEAIAAVVTSGEYTEAEIDEALAGGNVQVVFKAASNDVIAILDGDLPTWEAPTDDEALEPELDFDQLAEIARAWPWNVRDALARTVAHAEDAAGIDRAARRKVQHRLAVLFGEIDE